LPSTKHQKKAQQHEKDEIAAQKAAKKLTFKQEEERLEILDQEGK
jgi:hypothetical protein